MVALVMSLLLDQADAVDRHIESLGSDEIEVRERASAALRGMGEKALAPLRRALGASDAEVRARASDLLAALSVASPGTQLFALRNADPVQVTQLLRAAFQGIDGFEVAHDLRTRSIIVRSDDVSTRAAAGKIITELDRDPLEPQPFVVLKQFGSSESLASIFERLLRPRGGKQE